jgi:hypothetical protein
MKALNWNRVIMALWDNKQAITSTITAAISALAAAGMMSAETAVKITTVTGILAMVFALFYTIFKSATVQLPPPAPETLR